MALPFLVLPFVNYGMLHLFSVNMPQLPVIGFTVGISGLKEEQSYGNVLQF